MPARSFHKPKIMKKNLTFLALLVASPLFAAGAITLNSTLVPGVSPEPALPLQQKILLPEANAASGTAILCLKPEGWSQGEGKWHFFVNSGTLDNTTPYIYCYNQLDGRLRLVWSKNAGAGEVADIQSARAVEWRSGVWKQIAFTWKVENGETHLALYVDGRKIGGRIAPFAMSAEFPSEWTVGDMPLWEPNSEFPTRLGRTQILSEVLDEKHLESLAAQEFTPGGGQILVTRELLPGAECVIAGSAEGEAAGLRYDWRFLNEVGKTLAAPAIASKFDNGTFRFQFKMPDRAAELRFTVADADGKPVDFTVPEIRSAPPVPDSGPYYWKSAWIWGDNEFKPNAHCYLRRKFTVDDPAEVERAVFQWATDERSEVFINGTSIGSVSSWAVPKVSDAIQPLLKKGGNLIAVHAFNTASDAGFIGELTLVKRDGSTETIASGKDYRFSSKEEPGWNRPEFDDSVWQPARVKFSPPQNPYGAIAWHFCGRVWPLQLAHAELPTTVKAGKVLTISASYRGEAGFPDDRIRFSIRRNGREIAAVPAQVKRDGEEMKLSASLPIPAAAAGSTFEVVPESTVLQMPSPGSFAVSGGETAPLTAEVKAINGAPRLVINGRVEPMMLYRSPINEGDRDETSAYRFMTGFEKTGVTLFEISLRLTRLWKSDGTLEYSALDDNILGALFYAPKGRLVVFINMDAPAWYVEQNPQERFHFANAPLNQVSFASEKWRRDSAHTLELLLEHMKKQPYYNAIAGFGLDAGEDTQWMQWTGRNIENVGDYSPAMLRYFHAFLGRKYGDIAALNNRYGASYAGFDEIPIPAPELRGRKTGGLFFDPIREWSVADFNQAFSDAVTDNILAYSRIIKEETEKSRIVGVYYGKLFSIAGFNEWGEFGTGRILASPDIDYLVAPEYLERVPGKPHSVSAPLASYSLHNKIFVDEADLRTFVTGTKEWFNAGGLFNTASTIRKMFLLSFVKNHGIHFYDLHGGAFDQPGILDAIGRVRKVAETCKKTPPKRADVAIFIDETSLAATSSAVKDLSRRAILHQQSGNFGRMGANFDLYLQSDIELAQLPKYKMYVFLNAWKADETMRNAIDRLKQDHALFVWLFNSGINNGKTLSGANIEELTGIRMAELPPSTPLSMQLKPDATSPVNLLSRLPAAFVSVDAQQPAFYPVDPAATLFAPFVKVPDLKAAAFRDFGSWRSFYSAVPLLTPDLWRELAREAGCHIYTDDPGLMLYHGSELLGVHSGSAGEKKIAWPKRADFTDALTGEEIARDTSEVTVPLKKNETRILHVK